MTNSLEGYRSCQTGTTVGAAELDAFLESVPDDLVVAIDEAYFDFAERPDFPDSLGWVARRPATLVLRTFSKIHGLAALRLGWAYCPADVTDVLHRIRGPFNVNAPALAAGAAVMLMSHLGRPKEGEPDPALSLAPVAEHLAELLGRGAQPDPQRPAEKVAASERDVWASYPIVFAPDT